MKVSTCFCFKAVFKIIRNQGTFGSVSVSWATNSISTKDIFPDQGTIFFGNEEFSKDITIYSVPDEVIIFTVIVNCGRGANKFITQDDDDDNNNSKRSNSTSTEYSLNLNMKGQQRYICILE